VVTNEGQHLMAPGAVLIGQVLWFDSCLVASTRVGLLRAARGAGPKLAGADPSPDLAVLGGS